MGAGIGIKFPPVARIPLLGETPDDVDEEDLAEAAAPANDAVPVPTQVDDSPLTIAEAKRRLALTFGVDPSAIKITVVG
ncbi:hypothetical protein [Rhizobium sp. BK251]|uniref:hypothetical protein n=1 Tax=Rhizobium sp. BK251 TaxID=2512125 RepID=UPI001048D3C7|nr:hypothetical protein [Rhizobium sp. BK251]